MKVLAIAVKRRVSEKKCSAITTDNALLIGIRDRHEVAPGLRERLIVAASGRQVELLHLVLAGAVAMMDCFCNLDLRGSIIAAKILRILFS